MMYDIAGIVVLMHDVKMQLVNVFRWAFLEGEFREVGAIQGLLFCSQNWRFPVVDGCAGP